MSTPSKPAGFFAAESALNDLRGRLLGTDPVIATHFKGATYVVKGTVSNATHNCQEMVRYAHISQQDTEFVRTPEDFFATVSHNGAWVPRYRLA